MAYPGGITALFMTPPVWAGTEWAYSFYWDHAGLSPGWTYLDGGVAIKGGVHNWPTMVAGVGSEIHLLDHIPDLASLTAFTFPQTYQNEIRTVLPFLRFTTPGGLRVVWSEDDATWLTSAGNAVRDPGKPLPQITVLGPVGATQVEVTGSGTSSGAEAVVPLSSVPTGSPPTYPTPTIPAGVGCLEQGFVVRAYPNIPSYSTYDFKFDNPLPFGTPGPWTKICTGLAAGTKYNIRYYLVNSYGLGQSSVEVFTTGDAWDYSTKNLVRRLRRGQQRSRTIVVG